MITLFRRRDGDGAAAERAAEQWLRRRGLSTLARNYRCRLGEIDLIMRDGEQLVFVEVRLRSRSDFGGAAASVTRAKQQRLIRAAQVFLGTHPRLQSLSCRFDVMAGSGDSSAPTWQWLRDAFMANG